MRSLLLRSMVVSVVLLLAGCAVQRPKIIGVGSVDQGVYRNEYFGFILPIPKGAEITSKAETAQLMKEGVKAVVDPKYVPKVLDDTTVSLATMLAFYAKSTARKADDGLMLTVGAVNISTEVGFKDSTDYVGEMMDLVKTGPAKGDAVGTPYFIRFGGEDFAAQDCAITVAGQAARESINAAFLRGYAFIITAAYSNDAGRRRAQEILEAARFEPMKAGGWDGSASRLEERRRELEKAWGAATKPGGVARDKLARAKRRRAPDWTRKSAWREEYGGKSYVFGVGVARSIISPALRIDAAESRARSSIAAMSAAATVEEKMSGDGREAGRIIRSSADETLANVAAVDWYSDADGRAFYALVVETP